MKNEPRVPHYSSSKLTPFPKSPGKRPLAFMFQPTHYKVVSTPSQLKLWEKTMSKMWAQTRTLHWSRPPNEKTVASP